MNELINVVTDGIWRQGRRNLCVRLMPANGQLLPAWQAGAHIDVHLQPGIIRQYSLTGQENRRDCYEICVALEAESRGGSRYIHETLRPGMQLAISPPRNLFPLVAARNVILLAAGIGITPLSVMAQALEAAGQAFELHYYLKERGDEAFASALSQNFAHGVCHIWYSSEGVSARTHQPEGIARYQPGAHIYLCGPLPFMSHLQLQAETCGWPPEAIHTEAFKAAAPQQVTEQGAAFTITLARSGRSWLVPPDRSIAAVLTEQGVEVALSCEMGMCGACLTPVTEGQPDHRDTVQSDKEKAAPSQCIALCCSRSHTASLTIDL